MPTLRKDRGNAWLARVVINGGDCGQQVFPARADKWPGMACSQNMGRGKEKGAAARQGKEAEDPFGLRNILGLG